MSTRFPRYQIHDRPPSDDSAASDMIPQQFSLNHGSLYFFRRSAVF
jgi:hypothetical protein